MKKQLLFFSFIFVCLALKSQPTMPLYKFGFNNSLQCDNNPSLSMSYSNPVFSTDIKEVEDSAIHVTGVGTANLALLPQGNSPRTISLWVKFPDLNTNISQHIWSYGTSTTFESYGLYINQSGLIRNYSWANDLDIIYVLKSNTWYNIVTTYNGTKASVYVNGVEVGSGNYTNWNTVGTTFNIGQSTSGEKNVNAVYDELKIFNVALDSTEIAGLYHGRIDTIQLLNNLVSYYGFENKLTDHANIIELTNSNSVEFSASSYKGSGVVFNETNCLYSTEYENLLNTDNGESFTVSFYKKDYTAPTKNYPTFLEIFASYYFRYDNARKLQYGYASTATAWHGYTSGSSMFQQNAWRHIALVHIGITGVNRA